LCRTLDVFRFWWEFCVDAFLDRLFNLDGARPKLLFIRTGGAGTGPQLRPPRRAGEGASDPLFDYAVFFCGAFRKFKVFHCGTF
jgi:hypothetical protein